MKGIPVQLVTKVTVLNRVEVDRNDDYLMM